MLDAEAVYTVEQCVGGHYRDGQRQLVPVAFIESLRDAAFSMGVDYSCVVEPHFGTLAEYDRCIYIWQGAEPNRWATLWFHAKRGASLALIGAPGVEKLVGNFAYDICTEREALRLRDVGPYAEVLVVPLPDSSDVEMIVPETGTQIVLRNETPHRLRMAPAVPSYFDAGRE